ncbi:MAG: hypothetical protein EOO71_04270 [Myxococcaceae bacterium]|nr:MAG: hypothetical protein EOO71_04270 [Myxococcaceae bacterium]
MSASPVSTLRASEHVQRFPSCVAAWRESNRGVRSFFGSALKRDGTVWAWGKNDVGQAGDGTTTDRRTPVRVLTP